MQTASPCIWSVLKSLSFTSRSEEKLIYDDVPRENSDSEPGLPWPGAEFNGLQFTGLLLVRAW